MEGFNKNQISTNILRIMDKCQDLKVKERLQAIYNSLHGANSLENTGLIQRLKAKLFSLNPKYRKQIEMKRIETAVRELEDVVSENIVTDKIFQNKILKDYPSELAGTIEGFLDLHFGIEFNDEENSLKRYDIKLTDNMKKVAYSQVLKEIQQVYLNTDVSLNDLISETKKKYEQKIDAIISKAKKAEITPYYGDREFMAYRISYIIESIRRMLEHPKFQGRKDIETDLQYLQEKYTNYQSSSINMDSIEEQKSNYRQLESFYKEAASIEDKLSKDVEQVWKERMKEKNSAEGQMAYWAHVITAGEFNPEEMSKVCATYVTEKTLTLPYGDYGFLYEMDMENILQMAFTDAGSWKISKDEFIERGLCTSWQFLEPIDENGNRMFFEYPPHITKLLLPDDIEQRTIQETIRLNGEMLNYDQFMPYNEAVIINKNKKMLPKAVFVKTHGNEENSDKVKRATALSEKLGIELKKFDICRLRENQGLQPYTSGELEKMSR